MQSVRKLGKEFKEWSMLGKILVINLGIVGIISLYWTYKLFDLLMQITKGGTSVQYIWNHNSSFVIAMLTFLVIEVLVVEGFNIIMPVVEKSYEYNE